MNNKKYYIIIGFITAIALIVIWYLSSNELIEVKDNSTTSNDKLRNERLFINVHSDTLRILCNNYDGLDNLKFGVKNDTLQCNIVISKGNGDKAKRLFGDESISWKKKRVLNDNMISLETEIMPNGDTVVKCPVIMLFNLAKAYEEPRPAQQDL